MLNLKLFLGVILLAGVVIKNHGGPRFYIAVSRWNAAGDGLIQEEEFRNQPVVPETPNGGLPASVPKHILLSTSSMYISRKLTDKGSLCQDSLLGVKAKPSLPGVFDQLSMICRMCLFSLERGGGGRGMGKAHPALVVLQALKYQKY